MQQREFPGSACELLQGSRAGLARPRSRIASHRTKESLTKGPRRGVARVQAEKVLLEDLNSGKINKEYLPVTGLQDFLNVTSQVCAPVYPSRLLHFCALVARQHWVMGTRCDRLGAAHTQVILGKDSPIIKDKKVAICQSLSGTGALRISAEFLAQYNPGVDVYCSDPTWGNHHAIFAKAGLKTHKYRYLNKVLTSSSLRP